MRKSLSKIFEDAAKECGVNTCLYARIKEANYLLDYVKEYPVMLRLFQEPIYETNLTNRRRRRTTLYFLDALGKPEPDTQTEAAPHCGSHGANGVFINRQPASKWDRGAG